jgi:hypothetical protein
MSCMICGKQKLFAVWHVDNVDKQPRGVCNDCVDAAKGELAKRAGEIIADKDRQIAELREENANLQNCFNQLAGGFELQGDHKSAERVRAAL